jgi:hypothetical protein
LLVVSTCNVNVLKYDLYFYDYSDCLYIFTKHQLLIYVSFFLNSSVTHCTIRYHESIPIWFPFGHNLIWFEMLDKFVLWIESTISNKLYGDFFLNVTIEFSFTTKNRKKEIM